MALQKFTLILGGAASGKSAHAERLIADSGLSPVYVATAQAFDAEMTDKIARHRAARGPGWRTVESPHDPGAALETVTAGEAVLIDCATLWLTNLVLAGTDPAPEAERLLGAIGRCAGPVVVVSNEVGAGIVPEHALGRRFREAQGRLNQRLAAAADRVEAVMAGLPLVLK